MYSTVTATAVEKFPSAVRKLKRAEHHIDDLASEIANHVEAGNYALVVETDPFQPGHCCLVVHVEEPVPPMAAELMGDALHNLRCALDHLACDLVTANGGTVGRDVYFPIATTPEKLQKALSRRDGIGQAHGNALKYIAFRAPFRGGNDQLYALHVLNNQDKHREIVPILAGATVPRLKIPGGPYFTDLHFSPFENGRRLHSFSASPEFPVGSRVNVVPEVCFPDMMLLGLPSSEEDEFWDDPAQFPSFREAIGALREIHEEVVATINLLAELAD